MEFKTNTDVIASQQKKPNPGVLICVFGGFGLIQGMYFFGNPNQIASWCGLVSLVVSTPLMAYGAIRLIRKT